MFGEVKSSINLFVCIVHFLDMYNLFVTQINDISKVAQFQIVFLRKETIWIFMIKLLSTLLTY